MVDVMRMNFKFLIPTDDKKRELQLKLKPGEVVNARVMEVTKEKLLVNIKGTEVLTETGREFKKGDVVKLRVEGFDNDKLLVKVEEEKAKAPELQKREASQMIQERVKTEIVNEAIKEKILISNEKLDRVVEKYIKIKEEGEDKEETGKNGEDIKRIGNKKEGGHGGKQEYEGGGKEKDEENKMAAGKLFREPTPGKIQIPKSYTIKKEVLPDETLKKIPENIKDDGKTLKTLLQMEKSDIEYTKDVFNNIKAFNEKNMNDRIEINEHFKENLKEFVEKIKDGTNEASKGTNLINAINREAGENRVEFMFMADGLKSPAEIRITGESGKNTKNDKSENAWFLSMNLDMENMGNIEIKVNILKKTADISFGVINDESFEELKKSVDEIIAKIEAQGYKAGEVRVKKISASENETFLRGVNVKI